MDSQTFIKRTNQSWKITFYVVFTILLGVYEISMEFLEDVVTKQIGFDNGLLLTLSMLLVWVLLTVWIYVSVKCPNCQLKLIPFAINKRDQPRGIPLLITITNCPKCGV